MISIGEVEKILEQRGLLCRTVGSKQIEEERIVRWVTCDSRTVSEEYCVYL